MGEDLCSVMIDGKHRTDVAILRGQRSCQIRTRSNTHAQSISERNIEVSLTLRSAALANDKSRT